MNPKDIRLTDDTAQGCNEPPPHQGQGQGQKFRRRRKLIRPRTQLAVALLSAGLVMLALLLQTLLLTSALIETANTMPSGGQYLVDLVPAQVGRALLISFGVITPLTIAVGVLATFRIVGPVYRFEQYVKQVLRNERQGPCKIRKGDAFQSLCDLINELTDRLHSAEDTAHRNEREEHREPKAA